MQLHVCTLEMRKLFRDCETFAGIDNEEVRLALDDVGVAFYEEDR